MCHTHTRTHLVLIYYSLILCKPTGTKKLLIISVQHMWIIIIISYHSIYNSCVRGFRYRYSMYIYWSREYASCLIGRPFAPKVACVVNRALIVSQERGIARCVLRITAFVFSRRVTGGSARLSRANKILSRASSFSALIFRRENPFKRAKIRSVLKNESRKKMRTLLSQSGIYLLWYILDRKEIDRFFFVFFF